MRDVSGLHISKRYKWVMSLQSTAASVQTQGTKQWVDASAGTTTYTSVPGGVAVHPYNPTYSQGTDVGERVVATHIGYADKDVAITSASVLRRDTNGKLYNVVKVEEYADHYEILMRPT